MEKDGLIHDFSKNFPKSIKTFIQSLKNHNLVSYDYYRNIVGYEISLFLSHPEVSLSPKESRTDTVPFLLRGRP